MIKHLHVYVMNPC